MYILFIYILFGATVRLPPFEVDEIDEWGGSMRATITDLRATITDLRATITDFKFLFCT